MTMLWSLIVLILNSVVLYVVPEGRVAYWADWTFLGLTKSDWGAQHTTVGFLFLFAGLLHTYLNWKAIVTYMKNKAKEFNFFSGANTIGIVLTAVFVVGTLYNVPPMSTIMNISEHFKDSASETYGEPPYGHAESSSLKMFCKRENINLEKAMELLKSSNISFSGESDTIKAIAANNKKSPQQIYEIIKPAKNSAKVTSAPKEAHSNEAVQGNTFPDAPQSGWGKKVLSDVCATYNLDVNYIVKQLEAQGIKAQPGDKMKDIGEANDIEPMNVFEALHTIATSK